MIQFQLHEDSRNGKWYVSERQADEESAVPRLVYGKSDRSYAENAVEVLNYICEIWELADPRRAPLRFTQCRKETTK